MVRSLPAALLCACLLAGCGGSRRPLIVGSKNETEQLLLGEIVAQHLEHRLGRAVERRLGLGGTAVLYQAMITGDVGIYPEYAGLIESEILKEPASGDSRIVLERARAEIARVAQLELMDPLGFDNPPAMVISAAGSEGLRTLSDAVQGPVRWKLGVGFEFQSDGLSALNSYRLPMIAPPRSMDPKLLFAALEKGDVNMIAARATDGHLMSPDWKALDDDRKVFPSYEACLLVRQDLFASEPRLRAALLELSGKFLASTMRKLNSEVDLERRPVSSVASDFLKQAGLR